jgi:formylglycine-generating enzyme required for sulfatase activity/serine/threonine protein kinase
VEIDLTVPARGSDNRPAFGALSRANGANADPEGPAMKIERSSHPSAALLQAFDAGRLDESKASALLAHLDECPECHRAALKRPADSRLRRLRAAQPIAGTIPEISVNKATSMAGTPVLEDLSAETPLELAAELREHQQYEVLRELGRGGMGVVYLARHRLMKRLDVLKVVNPMLVRDPGVRERFLREIEMAARLRHPNVVTAYHAEQVGQLLMLVMEYAPGETLERVVANRSRPLPVVNACYYVQQVAKGLQHAFEQGMIHRDIKPQNLILTVTEKKTHVIRILDFGLAKACSDSEASMAGLTGSGMMMGTPGYMAPEQAEDASCADTRADIYSLGCTLYFLLVGQAPFAQKSLRGLLEAHASKEAPRVSTLRTDVPEELSNVIRRMMEKDPDRRYQKPEDVAKALAPFIDTKGLKPLAPSSPEPAKGSEEPTHRGKRSPADTGMKAKAGRVIPATIMERPAPVKEKKAKPKAGSKGLLIGLGAGALVVVLAVALVGLWAAGVFRVKTGEGILVLEMNDPSAEVFVDGERVSVTWGEDGKTAEIRTKPGTRKVEVRKGDTVMLGEEVELRDGKRRVLTVRMVADAGKAGGPGGQVPPNSGNPLPSDSGKKPDTGKAEDDKLLPGERREEFDYRIGPDTLQGRRRVMTLDIGGGEKMEFVRIKGGAFLMGAPDDEKDASADEKPQHRVTINRDFYLAKYTVTQGQFKAIMGRNPSYFSEKGGGAEAVKGMDTSRFPVENVSWDEATEYCETLSRSTGQKVTLPTEAEWEYACRAGTTTPFHFGKSLKGDLANCDGQRPYGTDQKGPHLNRTSEVGKYPANPWGLYDMHGNVFQWCRDYYGPYSGLSSVDPLRDKKENEDARVVRVGTWNDAAEYCRSARRLRGGAAYRDRYLGFRPCFRLDSLSPGVQPDPIPAVTKPTPKAPLPDEAAVAVAEKELKELFKTEFGKKAPAEQQAFAARLLQVGLDTKDKLAARYVLLREARDLAMTSGDMPLALRAAEEIANSFAISVWKLKAAALEMAATVVTAPAARINLATTALGMSDAAEEEEDYESAERLAKVAQTAVATMATHPLAAFAQGRIVEIAAVRKACAAVAGATRVHDERPDDADANLALGKFHALVRGDWDRGLSLLARGADLKLKALAVSDLATPADGTGTVALADAYAVLADSESGAAKVNLLCRAYWWYTQALGKLTGLDRPRVERTIGVIEKGLPPQRPIVLHARLGGVATWVDATDRVRSLMLAKGSKMTVAADGGPLGLPDVAPGEHKSLVIVYRYRGGVHLSIAGEKEPATIPVAGSQTPSTGRPAPGQELMILQSRYGNDGTYVDVTEKVQTAVKRGTLTGTPNELGLPDGYFGRRKALVIVYREGGRVRLSVTADVVSASLGSNSTMP